MWRGKLKKLEKEKYPLQDMEYGKNLKIMKNEKQTLEDLKNDEITKKREK